MTNKDELKPCPFCGGEADYVDNEEGKFIACIPCGLTNGGLGDWKKSKVISKWNTRAQPCVDVEEAQKAICDLNTAFECLEDHYEETTGGKLYKDECIFDWLGTLNDFVKDRGLIGGLPVIEGLEEALKYYGIDDELPFIGCGYQKHSTYENAQAIWDAAKEYKKRMKNGK